MHGISEPVVLYERISLRRPGYSAALVTLNRPDKYNCFNTEMVSRLSQIFADIADQADTTLVAVIFTGKGSSFCAGADLKDPPDPVKQSSDLPCCLNDNPVYQMGRVAIPIIGAVQGYVGFCVCVVVCVVLVDVDLYC
jgi:enoyl-CoA hydratase/carnithine racemase